jgi:HD-like signal output (HDOD) protein
MEQIANELKEHNRLLGEILKAIDKPERKGTQFLTIIATAVSVLGIVQVIDIIVNWIIGG